MSEASRETDGAYLRIRSLSKLFGDFIALRDVSLEIGEGEFVCFLGPSGCGKTTLLRAIAGLDIQTTGSIEQAGRDISALPPAERDFGIVFQSYALFPNMTVAKNVAYGLENRKTPRERIRARVRELLDLVGLPDQGEKYPAQLSGGQQQRIALARAIATSPGLLLLDEPLSALDAKVRMHLRQEVKALQRRLGVTTVMVTHDQEEALTMADRIVVMDHGIIEQIGTPMEIYREPRTSFVANFIGTMNFVRGRVIGRGRVRVGTVELECATDGLGDDQEVTIAVRPEDIVVHRAAGNQNTYQARVEAIEFLGSFVRADLVSEATGENHICAELSINQTRDMDISVGDTVPVMLPSERIRIFTAEESRG